VRISLVPTDQVEFLGLARSGLGKRANLFDDFEFDFGHCYLSSGKNEINMEKICDAPSW
jgi:hypothetical protein